MTDLHPRPRPVTPADPRSAARPGTVRVLATTLVAGLALVLGTALGAPAAGARPGQDPVTETTAVSGLEVVPGEVTTTVAGATADGLDPVAEGPVATTAPEVGAGSRRVADENRKIWVIVAGLVTVAVLLALLTVRYWYQTRPGRSPAPDVDGEPHGRRTRKAAATPPGRHSRRSVAGADHSTADEAWEPRGTGEHDRIVVPTAERRPRPDRAQRAAAYEAARGR